MYQQVSVHLTRKYNVDKFMQAVNIRILNHSPTILGQNLKQEANINLFYSSLVAMAGAIKESQATPLVLCIIGAAE